MWFSNVKVICNCCSHISVTIFKWWVTTHGDIQYCAEVLDTLKDCCKVRMLSYQQETKLNWYLIWLRGAIILSALVYNFCRYSSEHVNTYVYLEYLSLHVIPDWFHDTYVTVLWGENNPLQNSLLFLSLKIVLYECDFMFEVICLVLLNKSGTFLMVLYDG